MTDQMMKINKKVASLVSNAPTLQMALALAEAYRSGGDVEAAEGAMQTARAALTLIEDNLTYLREVCTDTGGGSNATA